MITPTFAITHHGKAHQDDLYTSAVLLGMFPSLTIIRREPIRAELEDPKVLIFDIGGEYNPEKNNFDHHQFPTPNPPESSRCALSLVLQALGKDEDARKFWNWLPVTEILDCLGPNGLANYIKTPWPILSTVSVNPLEGFILQSFAKEKIISPANTPMLHALLCAFGKSLLENLESLKKEIQKIPEITEVYLLKDLKIIEIQPKTKFSFGAFMRWVQEIHPDAAALIYPDDREEESTCLYRFNDHPKVDFTKVENLPGIRFAHKNGFIAKTTPEGTPTAKEFVALAIN